MKSPDHLGRSSEAKNPKNPKKVKCDGPMDGLTDGPTDRPTDGPTKRGVESRSRRLKSTISEPFDFIPHPRREGGDT